MASQKLLRYITPACVIPRLAAEQKADAIEELLQVLAAQDLLDDVERVRQDVFARESQMTTGLTQGLAIPHAKSVGAKDLTVAVGLKPEGLDFESIDGLPARAIFLVVSRPDRSGPHLECLAEIARAYSNEAVRRALLEADTAQTVIAALQS